MTVQRELGGLGRSWRSTSRIVWTDTDDSTCSGHAPMACVSVKLEGLGVGTNPGKEVEQVDVLPSRQQV
eukprot:366000-Chlamydomonas_euryale.AAC.59